MGEWELFQNGAGGYAMMRGDQRVPLDDGKEISEEIVRAMNSHDILIDLVRTLRALVVKTGGPTQYIDAVLAQAEGRE